MAPITLKVNTPYGIARGAVLESHPLGLAEIAERRGQFVQHQVEGDADAGIRVPCLPIFQIVTPESPKLRSA